jgi:hypothetical protein
MVKKVPRKIISSSDFKKYYQLSQKFYEGAKLAVDYENYNSAGVLIVHAAIALADAVTIRFSSAKASGDNHYEVIKLLQETAPDTTETKSALNHFEKIIDHKNAVSYQGKHYVKADIDQLLKHYSRFSVWAETIL